MPAAGLNAIISVGPSVCAGVTSRTFQYPSSLAHQCNVGLRRKRSKVDPAALLRVWSVIHASAEVENENVGSQRHLLVNRSNLNVWTCYRDGSKRRVTSLSRLVCYAELKVVFCRPSAGRRSDHFKKCNRLSSLLNLAKGRLTIR